MKASLKNLFAAFLVGIFFTAGNQLVVEYKRYRIETEIAETKVKIDEASRKLLALAAAQDLAIDVLGTARAATTVHVPDSFLYDAVRGQIVFGTDTIKCGLAPSSYTYNRATHTKRSDVTEIGTSTGYTAGGQTVTVTVTNDTTNHKLTIGIPQIVWSGSTTITARYLWCAKSTGTASTDPLITVADFGVDVSSSGGTFTVQAITLEYTHF